MRRGGGERYVERGEDEEKERRRRGFLLRGLFSAADESTFKKDPNLGLPLRLLQLLSSEDIGEVPVQLEGESGVREVEEEEEEKGGGGGGEEDVVICLRDYKKCWRNMTADFTVATRLCIDGSEPSTCRDPPAPPQPAAAPFAARRTGRNAWHLVRPVMDSRGAAARERPSVLKETPQKRLRLQKHRSDGVRPTARLCSINSQVQNEDTLQGMVACTEKES
ncbi:hypothetical protein EYF80_038371 [Liparis tanakae]|uniref:Uncharacterized protein n=1 Tax=Liparis tanakae TaxID=230148 RepID=A0A4Z2GCX3_9TELE|nr:hypothetical protein EYF80_038371 [Liparis tanakae]